MSCENCTGNCKGKCKTEKEKLEDELIRNYMKKNNIPHFEYSYLKELTKEMTIEEIKESLKEC